MINPRELRSHITTVAAELDLPLTVKHVDQLAVRVVARAARRERAEFLGKTPSGRCHTVLLALAAGESEEETATRLGVSVYTVKTHKRRLYALLGARNAAHAVAIGAGLGLLDGDAVTARSTGGAE